jgi:histone H3/H4
MTQFSTVLGRTSDIRPQEAPEDDSEITFILPLPGQDSPSDRSDPRGQAAKEQHDEQGREDEVQSVDIDGLGRDVDGDVNMHDPSLMYSGKLSQGQRKGRKVKKGINVSRYGIQYSLLPTGVVKKLATTLLRTSKNSNATFSKDAVEAIMQASDWFFEQVSDDLGVYAEHSGRRTIDETDVLTLIKR